MTAAAACPSEPPVCSAAATTGCGPTVDENRKNASPCTRLELPTPNSRASHLVSHSPGSPGRRTLFSLPQDVVRWRQSLSETFDDRRPPTHARLGLHLLLRKHADELLPADVAYLITAMPLLQLQLGAPT